VCHSATTFKSLLLLQFTNKHVCTGVQPMKWGDRETSAAQITWSQTEEWQLYTIQHFVEQAA